MQTGMIRQLSDGASYQITGNNKEVILLLQQIDHKMDLFLSMFHPSDDKSQSAISARQGSFVLRPKEES